MSIFKNDNEAAYVGGRKHFTDVIKNGGSGEYLIWRQPEEDFNNGSTLVVMPGEAAVFVNGGNVEAVFEKGTYKLTTKNYPFISRLRNSVSGGVSVYNCVIYFIRKAITREIPWGTDSRIQVRDKRWNVRTDVGLRGVYNISVGEPALFLEKLVGNNIGCLSQDEVPSYFEGKLKTDVISRISKFLNEWEGELIGLQEHQQELSDSIFPEISQMLATYGIKLESFSIEGIVLDSSKYDQIDEYHMAAMSDKIRKVENAKADMEVFGILGDKWDVQKSADIMKAAAENEGSGGIGAGIGVAMAAAGSFRDMGGKFFAGKNDESMIHTNEQRIIAERIKLLKTLYEEGVLTEDAYKKKLAEILSEI